MMLAESLREAVKDLSIHTADADGGGWTVVAFGLRGFTGHVQVCRVTAPTCEQAISDALHEITQYRRKLELRALEEASK